jgi:16S rRNA (guanine(966)-N(2))-methyltransferase RsmD
MDRMRESVFAVLGDLSGLSFLDLFSGSGVIALEAASRGAGRIEAVEADPLKRKTLLSNAALALSLVPPLRIQCHFIAVELYVKRAKEQFDYIFCDPPFPYQYKAELLRNIAASPLCGEESCVLLHRPREEGEKIRNEMGPGLVLKESRRYGRSEVDFFKKNASFVEKSIINSV